MVNIQLGSGYSLQSDRYCWVIVKDGRMQTFHTTMESAIESLFERKLRLSQAQNLQNLIDYHKQCVKALNQAMTPLKIEIVHVKEFLAEKLQENSKSEENKPGEVGVN